MGNANIKGIPIIYMMIYRLCLDLIYRNYIIIFFGYGGFYGEDNIVFYLLSWVVFICFTFFISNILNNSSNLSSIVLLILYLISFVPFTTMIGFNSLSESFYLFNTIYWFLLIAIYHFIKKIKLINLPKFERGLSDLVIWLIGIISLSIILFVSWRYTGFRFTFNILDVYSIRGDIIVSLPTIFQYAYSATSAINPILLIYALIQKNYPFAFFIIIVQLLSFGINGSKSIFFMTLLTVLIYYIVKTKFHRKIISLLTILSAISIVEYVMLESSFFIDFIIRRIMFVPNLINYFYFDFFSINIPDYFIQSIFSDFGVKSNYGRIPNIIGEIYLNNPETAANSGLISDAMQNLGLIGVFIFPLLLNIFFKILDDVSAGLDKRIMIIVSVYVTNILISSTLMTSLLTHGIFAIILLLFFIPRNQH